MKKKKKKLNDLIELSNQTQMNKDSCFFVFFTN